MQNYGATILAQYGAAPVIGSLLASFNAAVDPAPAINAFYADMWNIASAQGYGLDVWGRIVGVTRVVQLTSPGGYLGFNIQGVIPLNQPWNPFGFGVFWTGVPATSSYALTDQAYLLLLYAKALANISRASIPIYNAILGLLFPGQGNAYVTDTGNMQEQLTFEFYLQPWQIAVLKQSGALQAPTGVQFDILVVPVGSTFGFKEAGYASEPFGQGTFFDGFS